MTTTSIITIFVTTVVCCTTAARILCVLPHLSFSHHMVISPYLKELANRGHRLHVISGIESPHPNITDIVIKGFGFKAKIPELTGFSLKERWNKVFMLYELGQKSVNQLMGVQEVRELLNDDKLKFDLVITEHFNSEFTLGFAAKYNAPFLLFNTSPLLSWTASIVGQPHNLANRPATLSGLSRSMTLVERFKNVLITYVWNLAFQTYYRPWSQRKIKEYFGLDVDLAKLATNVSLVFVNSHFSIYGMSPNVPQVLEVGGIHLGPSKALPQSRPDSIYLILTNDYSKVKELVVWSQVYNRTKEKTKKELNEMESGQLWQDIQTFIDESEHGVIYFCMGSLLRGETFPAEKRKMFLDVFEKIPQRVLWKWEGEELPGRTSNIMIRKWMPQRDILAHPNVKLFISHGGASSTIEAVYEGVPILGMPILADQMTNIQAIKYTGSGEWLDYDNLNKFEILSKVKDVIANPIYRQEAKKLSKMFRDRPSSPMETAIYWTEYVIRNKDVPHLRSPAVGMSWYQYYMVDIILAFLIFILALISTLYCLISMVFYHWRPSKKLKTN